MAFMLDGHVFEVQRLYPQIYLACHVDHIRAATTKWRLSARDGSILSHLSTRYGMSPRALAAHIGVVPSTLSAVLTRLEKLGYIKNIPRKDDRRKREVWLTSAGVRAMSATSVLDAGRIRQMLKQLTPNERDEAIRGLALLGRAACALKEEK
jgi:DNA-binding MarR family transcriptional regulator